MVAAFIEDLVETARHLAAASPGARLDPPLLMALDEIGNLSPLPSMPVLMAEGGGIDAGQLRNERTAIEATLRRR